MSRRPLRTDYDVVIAGARCAGAATGMLLARAGLRVLIVDPVPRGRDTLSTHALMRGAVLQLSRWGLLDAIRASGAPPIRSTIFDYADETIEVPIEPRGGVDALYAPRRTVLDRVLSDAAEEAGAEVLRQVRVGGALFGTDGRVTGAVLEGRSGVQTVSTRWLIGADGVRSRVARMVGAATIRATPHSTASVYGYLPGLGSGSYRWMFRQAVGVGTIPTNDGLSCVFASVAPSALERRRAHLRDLFEETLHRVDPELGAHVRERGGATGLRAFAGLPGHLRQAVGSGWALVGDAGYFRDPLTAHGISDALREAERLAMALVDGGGDALDAYGRGRDRTAEGMLEVADRIAALDWSTGEVKELHRRLSREMKVGLKVIEGWDRADATAAGLVERVSEPVPG